MALFNYASKEITLKVVYYGPGLSGKTTNLQYLHPILDKQKKSKLLSLSTEADRTLFFDFLPVELGKIKDFSVRFQLYTVPGQVRYNATRRLVLKGADAVVFVADSQRDMREQNTESFENMRENLLANNIDPDGIPVVLQFNKRDLSNVLTPDEMDRDLNEGGYQTMEAEAINGKGVLDTFQLVTRLLIEDIARKHRVSVGPQAEMEPVAEPTAEVPKAEALPAETGAVEWPEPETMPETTVEPEPIRPAYEGTRLEGLMSDSIEPGPGEAILGEETIDREPAAKDFFVEPALTEPAFPELPESIEERSGGETEELQEPYTEDAETRDFTLGASPELDMEELQKIEDEIIKSSTFDAPYGGPAAYTGPGAEDFDDIKDKLSSLASSVESLKNIVEGLSKETKAVKPEVSLKDFTKLSARVEETLLEVSKEIKESKARQHEILGALKELKFIISNLKAKKSWFQF